jgi:hypothetical protein
MLAYAIQHLNNNKIWETEDGWTFATPEEAQKEILFHCQENDLDTNGYRITQLITL